MKTLESFFSRTAQFGLLIYLTGCFGLLIVLGAAVVKWLKLIDVIQYIAFAFGLGLLTLLIGMVGLSLLGIRGIKPRKIFNSRKTANIRRQNTYE